MKLKQIKKRAQRAAIKSALYPGNRIQAGESQAIAYVVQDVRKTFKRAGIAQELANTLAIRAVAKSLGYARWSVES